MAPNTGKSTGGCTLVLVMLFLALALQLWSECKSMLGIGG